MAKVKKTYVPGKNRHHKHRNWWKYLLCILLGQILIIPEMVIGLGAVASSVTTEGLLTMFGLNASEYVSDEVKDDTLLSLVSKFIGGNFKFENLGDIKKVSPALENLYDKYVSYAETYGVEIDRDAFFNTDFEKFPEFLLNTLMDVKLATTLEGANVNISEIPVLNELGPNILYKIPVARIELLKADGSETVADADYKVVLNDTNPFDLSTIVKYYPQETTETEIAWSSSNPDVLKITDDGAVAVDNGTVTLTAEPCDEAQSQTITFEVSGITPAPQPPDDGGGDDAGGKTDKLPQLIKREGDDKGDDDGGTGEGGIDDGGETGGQTPVPTHEHHYTDGYCTELKDDGSVCGEVWKKARSLGEIISMFKQQKFEKMFGDSTLGSVVPTPLPGSLGEIQIAALLKDPLNTFMGLDLGGLLESMGMTGNPLLEIFKGQTIATITSQDFLDSITLGTFIKDATDIPLVASLKDLSINQLISGDFMDTLTIGKLGLGGGMLDSLSDAYVTAAPNKYITVSDRTNLTEEELGQFKETGFIGQVDYVQADEYDSKATYYIKATDDKGNVTYTLVSESQEADLANYFVKQTKFYAYENDGEGNITFTERLGIGDMIGTIKLGKVLQGIENNPMLSGFADTSIADLPEQFNNLHLYDVLKTQITVDAEHPLPAGATQLEQTIGGETRYYYIPESAVGVTAFLANTILDDTGDFIKVSELDTKLATLISKAKVSDILDMSKEKEGSLVLLFENTQLNSASISKTISELQIGMIIPSSGGKKDVLSAISQFYLQKVPDGVTGKTVQEGLADLQIGDLMSLGTGGLFDLVSSAFIQDPLSTGVTTVATYAELLTEVPEVNKQVYRVTADETNDGKPSYYYATITGEGEDATYTFTRRQTVSDILSTLTIGQAVGITSEETNVILKAIKDIPVMSDNVGEAITNEMKNVNIGGLLGITESKDPIISQLIDCKLDGDAISAKLKNLSVDALMHDAIYGDDDEIDGIWKLIFDETNPKSVPISGMGGLVSNIGSKLAGCKLGKLQEYGLISSDINLKQKPLIGGDKNLEDYYLDDLIKLLVPQKPNEE